MRNGKNGLKIFSLRFPSLLISLVAVYSTTQHIIFDIIVCTCKQYVKWKNSFIFFLFTYKKKQFCSLEEKFIIRKMLTTHNSFLTNKNTFSNINHAFNSRIFGIIYTHIGELIYNVFFAYTPIRFDSAAAAATT